MDSHWKLSSVQYMGAIFSGQGSKPEILSKQQQHLPDC